MDREIVRILSNIADRINVKAKALDRQAQLTNNAHISGSSIALAETATCIYQFMIDETNS